MVVKLQIKWKKSAKLSVMLTLQSKYKLFCHKAINNRMLLCKLLWINEIR